MKLEEENRVTSEYAKRLLGLQIATVEASNNVVFVDLETRWTSKMEGERLKKHHWRKHWHWFGLLRSHAQIFVNDTEVDSIFR